MNNPIAGLSLAYFIGRNEPGPGTDGVLTVAGYDATAPCENGMSAGYCNLFNEKYDEQSDAERAKYAPYLHTSDVADEYNEGQIDPEGQGWNRNLDEQFARRRAQGFRIIELDNPDAYVTDDVIAALDRMFASGIRMTLAKNAALCSEPATYLRHPTVCGVIVERNCGTPDLMDRIRIEAGKPDLPVWFVAFGSGWEWAHRMAEEAAGYIEMSVTYYGLGEYAGEREELLAPTPAGPRVGCPDTVIV
jgi:hypothetical protein